jgi:hypothetical protein
MLRRETIIVDSRDRLAGGSPSDFFVNLRPGLANVLSARLLYVDLPSPGGVSANELYYHLGTSLGSAVRSVSQGHPITFVVPRSGADGYRTFWTQDSQFNQVLYEQPEEHVSSLAVSVRTRAGTAALAGEWYMIIEFTTA